VKHLSGAPLLVRFLALPTNIRPGWKGLPEQTLSLLDDQTHLIEMGLGKLDIQISPGKRNNHDKNLFRTWR
jgi:hypothetical protein